MASDELYIGREQTLVKHYILEHYLERFARIIGSKWNSITYVDCFSGPWKAQSESFQDSSFAIALKELLEAKRQLTATGIRQSKPDLSIGCFFLEKDRNAYRDLETYAQSVSDAQVVTKNKALEEAIPDILAFVKSRGDTFTFIFIDPTGWTGFSLGLIRPLLKLNNCEVMINFMTSHIIRFVEHGDPANQAGFNELFGPVDFRSRIAGKFGQDREDELVNCYRDAVAAAGNFRFACPAIVLHPQIDRTHFHLIYASRNPKGLEVFKDAERKAMQVMEEARANAQANSRLTQTGQMELFTATESHSPAYYVHLRSRYLGAAHQWLQNEIQASQVVDFDRAWMHVMSIPLVWSSDLTDWIIERKKSGYLFVEGLAKAERVPKLGKGHRLVFAPK